MPRTTNEDLRNAIQHALDILEEAQNTELRKTDFMAVVYILQTAISNSEPD